MVDGVAATLDGALDAAAARLHAAAMPLFGGLATDVDGMRALYRVANGAGAILDHAHGDALMHGLRTLQDRGQFFTTLAEIRNRADLIVCIGTDAVTNYPEFFRRCAPASGQSGPRRVVFVQGGERAPTRDDVQWASDVEHVAVPGDIFDAAGMLAALVSERRIPGAVAALANLAERMRAARYCVVVWEPARLPEHGALVAEALLRLVVTLNRKTRAAAFALGGTEGGQTANAVMTWLSGLPLRSRIGPLGVDHDPLQYATARLLAERSVDLLLWVATFTPDLPPPDTDLPRIVLGHPGLVTRVARPGTVFIPVATPGINGTGHLFRTDGVVVLPLERIRDDGLPSAAAVLRSLHERLSALCMGAVGEGPR